jgi:hypothetical protein
MVHSIVLKFEKIWLSHTLNKIFSNFHTVYHKIQVNFDYGVFHIYRSWVVVLFLLENRDFLGFRMIFKVPLNVKPYFKYHPET